MRPFTIQFCVRHWVLLCFVSSSSRDLLLPTRRLTRVYHSLSSNNTVSLLRVVQADELARVRSLCRLKTSGKTVSKTSLIIRMSSTLEHHGLVSLYAVILTTTIVVS